MHNEKDELIEMKPLTNCGAGGIFIDQNFTWKHGIRLTELEQPIKAQNVDGTRNKQGTIKYYADLDVKIGDRKFHKRFYVTGLGNQKVILGLPWLRTHNPEIEWKEGTVTWRDNLEWSEALVKRWRLEREQLKAK